MSEHPFSVDPHEVLINPRRRKFVHEYVLNENGEKELHISFDQKEISFDSVAEAAFGEQLLEHDSFVAGSTTSWSRGEPFAWEKVREWLEALLSEGILERFGAEQKPLTESAAYLEFLKHEETRPAPDSPQWWNPDCGPILEKLTGYSVELGYLECVVPVYRMAHPALDQESRQVGEMNVFPEELRMKIPTERKRCNFSGSRFQHELPMNVTALKTMIHYWQEMLQGILAIREEFIRRVPIGPKGWKLGDVIGVSSAVLAVPTYMLMRADDPSANGTLDPILSSIFRVVDGVRMVSNYLILWLNEPRTFDTPITGAQLHFLTERDNHFMGGRGACAGPKNMVDELFDTLLDGKPIEGELKPIGHWVRHIPAGIDYGLIGNQIFTVTRALWSRTAHAYDLIRTAILQDPAGVDVAGSHVPFKTSLDRDFEIIEPGHMHIPEERAWHDARYAELFEGSQRGVRGFEENQLIRLSDVLAPLPGVLGDAGRRELRSIFRSHPGLPYADATVETIADATYEVLRVERSVLGALNKIQRRLNVLMKRPHPIELMTGDQLGIGNRLQVGSSVPYLMDLFRELGIVINNTEVSTRVTFGSHTVELE